MAIAAWAALVFTMGVFVGVRGLSSWPEAWWSSMAVIAGVLVLWIPLRASRLKWFSMVRELETAEPREVPYGTWSTDHWSLLRTTHPGILRAMYVLYISLMVPVLAVSILWEPYLVGVQLWLALDWTGRGLVAARWERRQGVLLWLGRKGRAPSEYYYTPVSPRPPTRTATDAPPG
jgi:hypothetical protein